MKLCSKCLAEKKLDEFPKKGSLCKACFRIYHAEWSKNNKAKCEGYRKKRKAKKAEYDTEYSAINRAKISKRQADWEKDNFPRLQIKNKIRYQKNKKKMSAQHRKYWEENKVRLSELNSIYYQNNKKIISDRNRKYKIRRLQNDPLFKLSDNIRSLILRSFNSKGWKKSTKTQAILNCDFITLQKHLQETAIKNYGIYDPHEKYHIDHVIPLSIAKTPENLIRLNHYTNLQFLKPIDNLSKRDKIPEGVDISDYL